MRENTKKAALDYLKSIHVEYDSDPVIAYCAFGAGAEWMLEQFEKWLRKTGKGQLIGSLNRFLEELYDR